MRIRLTVVGGGPPDGVDVVIEAPPGTTLATVAGDLAVACGAGDDTVWAGSRALPPGAVLGGPGLREGAVVGVGRPGPRDPGTGSLLHLAVVGGPCAGRGRPVELGLYTVGRGADVDFRLTDDDVSRRHLSIAVTTEGVTVRDLESTNGSRLEGRTVDPAGSAMALGELLVVGSSTLVLRAGGEPPPVLRPDEQGRVIVVRAPRRDGMLDGPPDVEWPAPPPDRSRPAVQWIGAMLPAIVGVAMAYFLHTWQFLAFAALTPLTVLGTAAGDRWSWRTGRRRAAAAHAVLVVTAQTEQLARIAYETHTRRRAHADAAALGHTGVGPDGRLWERRPGDRDAFTVRLGTADRPARLHVRHADGRREVAGTLKQVPVVADLRCGPLGLAGSRPALDGLVRALIGQLAVTHSPADVEFVALLSDGATTNWDWLRWLPHRVTLAADGRSRATLIEQLERRLAESPDWTAGNRTTVLIIDRVGVLAGHPVLARTVATGHRVGWLSVCVDETAAALPGGCACIAVLTGETGTHLRTAGQGWWPQEGTDDSCGPVVADRVGIRWAERLARALAPLCDPAGGDGGAVPDVATWADVLPTGCEPVWPAEPGTDELRVTLGIGSNGPVQIDLVTDGPHALIAGTTGSGKSELLQTLMAGLAHGYSPDTVTMLLVDYKGGAAFGAGSALPHTVGLLTDLDRHLTRRVLASLEAELHHRERLLAGCGAPDLAAYRRQRPTTPLPRLVILVDEFATLAADLPAFVPGLVDIAQRGRSLGMHLVLATQRPSGVVSPEIRANTSLRIALRVTDPGESQDVIGVPAAAGIDPGTPGRAFIRTGQALTEVQTARVTAAASDGRPPISVRSAEPWSAAGAAPADGDAITELDRLVGASSARWARRVAAGAVPVRVPWRSPLPTRLPRASLGPATDLGVAVGRLDRPELQYQGDDVLDLNAGGVVLFVGAPRSGRTSALHSVVAGALAGPAGQNAAGRVTPAAIAIIDAAGTSASLISLAGVCAQTRGDDAATITRTVELLTAECAARRTALAAAGVSNLGDLEPAERPFGPLLLLVDGWEAVVATLDALDAGRATDGLLNLCREAPAVGLTVLLAGDRSLLTPRVLAVATRTYALRLADVTDYAILGVAALDVPTTMPPGRALLLPGGIETQFAQPPETMPAPQHPGGDHGTLTGFSLRPLPVAVDAADLDSVPTGWLAWGVGGDRAATVALDPWAGAGRLVVAGPPRSGRSTALVCLAGAAVRDGGSTVVCIGRPHSPLADWAIRHGQPVFGPETAALPSSGRRLILLDDAEEFADAPVSDAVLDLLRRAAPGTTAVVVAGRPDSLALAYRGVVTEVRRSRRGLLLQPGAGDGDLIGVRTGRSSAITPVGRGLLVADGVQIGHADASGRPVPLQLARPAAGYIHGRGAPEALRPAGRARSAA